MNTAPARGFSLVEVAVALAVIGALAAVAFSALRVAEGGRARVEATVDAGALAREVVAFALLGFRLPCPDVDGDGREGDADGGCPAGALAGWFPYESVGLAPVPENRRARYAVFRDAAAGLDLAVRAERSGDPAGHLRHADGEDLVVALEVLARRTTVDGAQPFLTGEGTPEAPFDCAAHRVANPAFVIALPGAEDRDGNGNPFDGPHGAVPTGWCFAAPSASGSATYDDVVAAMGAAELLGRLRAM